MSPTADRFHALIRGETRGARAGLARAGLWWARIPYGTAVWVRNRMYDHGLKKISRAAVPVVSVGNLTLGGTGKTPCVEYVARFFRDLDLRVAILSRGYGAETGANDEAMVLEENLPDVPHLLDRDRVALAATAVAELESEVLVLDDGFQHRRLARNLDLVLADATRPLMAEYLFPRGLLREPLGELRRAGAFLLTRCDQAGTEAVERQRTWLAERFPGTPIATSVHAPIALIGTTARTAPVSTMSGQRIGAFCGIGNPGAFRQTLAGLGAEVVDFRSYPDHHAYARTDVEELQHWAKSLLDASLVATTQKDFVKLRIDELGGRPLWAVRVGLEVIAGEAELQSKLRTAVGIAD